MAKSEAMEKALNKISQELFGRKRNNSECVCCGSNKICTEDFRDEISRREFAISYMCQKCQDKTFGE